MLSFFINLKLLKMNKPCSKLVNLKCKAFAQPCQGSDAQNISFTNSLQQLLYCTFINFNAICVIPVTVSIGELTSGVFKVIFLVKAEVKSCNMRKNNFIILKKSHEISHPKPGVVHYV